MPLNYLNKTTLELCYTIISIFCQGLPEYQAQLDQEKRGKFVTSSKSSCLFSFHDVIETSYHFVAQKINLHLSDDPGSKIYLAINLIVL